MRAQGRGGLCGLYLVATSASTQPALDGELETRRQLLLARRFGVRETPTYVLLDAEGIEQPRAQGAAFHEARNLSAAVERQIKLSTTPRP
jgi:hypothetical protein